MGRGNPTGPAKAEANEGNGTLTGTLTRASRETDHDRVTGVHGTTEHGTTEHGGADRYDGTGPWRTAVAAVAALLLTVAALEAAAEPLRFAHSTWVGNGPFYVARERGFFEEEGVAVELIVMEDVKTRLPALAAGRIDVTTTTVDTVLTFYSERRPFRYLFATDDSAGGDGVVAAADVRTVADLRGKRVAYSEGSVSQFYLSVLLREAGLTLDDVETLNMTAGDAGAAFVAGRVDAAVTWEPWLTRGKQARHGHLLVDSSSSPGLIVDAVVTTEQRLAERADDLRAFYRAWVRAVAWQREHEEEADAIMARGVGGWLRDAAVFKETRAGITYYGAARNAAFIGTPQEPGAITATIGDALALGREAGLFDHDLDPAALIGFAVVNP